MAKTVAPSKSKNLSEKLVKKQQKARIKPRKQRSKRELATVLNHVMESHEFNVAELGMSNKQSRKKVIDSYYDITDFLYFKGDFEKDAHKVTK